jgi:hypothetical protein
MGIKNNVDGSDYQKRTYDNYEGALSSVTNWSLKTTGHSGSMNNDPFFYAEIRTDATITVKINSATADGITVTSTSSPFVITEDLMEMKDIFVTNSGSANVKIFTR